MMERWRTGGKDRDGEMEGEIEKDEWRGEGAMEEGKGRVGDRKAEAQEHYLSCFLTPTLECFGGSSDSSLCLSGGKITDITQNCPSAGVYHCSKKH